MNRRTHIDMQVHLPRQSATNRVGEGLLAEDAKGQAVPHAYQISLEQKLKTYGSRELFAGAREVAIEHEGALYRLKITRQGKLILNK